MIFSMSMCLMHLDFWDFQVRRAVEKVITEMNRTDGIYFEQRVPSSFPLKVLTVLQFAGWKLMRKPSRRCLRSTPKVTADFSKSSLRPTALSQLERFSLFHSAGGWQGSCWWWPLCLVQLLFAEGGKPKAASVVGRWFSSWQVVEIGLNDDHITMFMHLGRILILKFQHDEKRHLSRWAHSRGPFFFIFPQTKLVCLIHTSDRPEDLYKKSRVWAGDIAKKGNNNTRWWHA